MLDPLETGRPGSPNQSHQDRLSLVVKIVSRDDVIGLPLLGHPSQRLQAKLARRLLKGMTVSA